MKQIINILIIIFISLSSETLAQSQNTARGYEGTDRRYTDGQTRFFDIVPTADTGRDSGNLLFKFQHDAPLAATPVLAGSGAGNVDNGTHSYKVTYVTGSGETSGGAVSVIVTVSDKTANGQIALSAVGKGNGNVTARKVYRTIAGDTGNYKLVGTISNNTATTFTDNVADSSLGADIPTTNTTIDTTYIFSSAGMAIPNNAGYLIYDTAGNRSAGLVLTTANNLSLSTPSLGGNLLYQVAGSDSSLIHQWSLNGTERLRLTQTGLLTFGGATSSQPALKPSGTTLQFRLADDSAFANASLNNLTINGTCTGCGGVAGSDTQVQYNNAGSAAGTSQITIGATVPQINDSSSNELLKFIKTTSAVNEVTLANSATGSNPIFSATGGDSNLGISFRSKGNAAAGFGLSYDAVQVGDMGFGNQGQIAIFNGSSVKTIDLKAAAGVALASTMLISFNPNNSFVGNPDDTAVGRNSAGIVEINSGSFFDYRDLKLRHIIGGSTSPSIAAGAGAGTSPTISLTGTDLAGQINVTSGTLPSVAAVIATITFSAAYGTAPYCVMWPANANAAVLSFLPYISSTTTTFTVNAPAIGLGAATQYLYNYHCTQ